MAESPHLGVQFLWRLITCIFLEVLTVADQTQTERIILMVTSCVSAYTGLCNFRLLQDCGIY